jgi:hypothetical protein
MAYGKFSEISRSCVFEEITGSIVFTALSLEVKKTRPDHKKTTDCSFDWSLDHISKITHQLLAAFPLLKVEKAGKVEKW